jgi:hypothetical protein
MGTGRRPGAPARGEPRAKASSLSIGEGGAAEAQAARPSLHPGTAPGGDRRDRLAFPRSGDQPPRGAKDGRGKGRRRPAFGRPAFGRPAFGRPAFGMRPACGLSIQATRGTSWSRPAMAGCCHVASGHGGCVPPCSRLGGSSGTGRRNGWGTDGARPYGMTAADRRTSGRTGLVEPGWSNRASAPRFRWMSSDGQREGPRSHRSGPSKHRRTRLHLTDTRAVRRLGRDPRPRRIW